jgi:hypothetical protein
MIEPKYQVYSWQKKQREDLFGDLRELAKKGEDRHHFMATIVCFRTSDVKSFGSLEYRTYDIVEPSSDAGAPPSLFPAFECFGIVIRPLWLLLWHDRNMH